MNAWLTSLIAVAGTLLGSTSTFLFQRLNTARTERFTRDERLRQDRTEACVDFAGAITGLRRGAVSLWLLRRRAAADDEDLRAAFTESDVLGAAADHARFRVALLTGDPELVALADVAFEHCGAIRDAADHAELAGHEERCQQALDAFIDAAGVQVRGVRRARRRSRRGGNA
ncbi:hypothetical protein ACFWIW_14405 [Amycolatopsis sp. NPDC058340]|uniref:hypothetical protein n=1 Tax=Amycolatopsis sp. NPDC058340 TaxID=3346453 RepID=UPI003665CA0F